MPHKPADLQKKMQAAAPSHVEWRYRPMFGGIGVYADDRMCVSLSDVGLAVKLAPAEQAKLLALKGAKRLQYEPAMPPSKTYIVVPDAMLSNAKALGHWLAASAAHAAGAAAKKPRKPKVKVRRRAA
ncbi:MAG TPA: TfoX/Sxy family protein [Rhizomicrobium sp.]|jgi:TfoX/Sxy family transcriptional regulator of competence genes|nr:TfoX/Sxy family protein [Rhizomicrobium sp.]